MPARLGPQRPSDDRRSGREDERNGRALMLLLVRSVGSLGPFGTMGQW
jgi:hypothetical protein